MFNTGRFISENENYLCHTEMRRKRCVCALCIYVCVCALCICVCALCMCVYVCVYVCFAYVCVCFVCVCVCFVCVCALCRGVYVCVAVGSDRGNRCRAVIGSLRQGSCFHGGVCFPGPARADAAGAPPDWLAAGECRTLLSGYPSGVSIFLSFIIPLSAFHRSDKRGAGGGGVGGCLPRGQLRDIRGGGWGGERAGIWVLEVWGQSSLP